MKIMNLGKEDYHVHTITYSDGLNSVDEIVKMAEDLGMSEIAITDHSQIYLDKKGFGRKSHRDLVSGGRWKNVFGDMKVIFGIEADLLNEDGDICSNIQGIESDFLVLSAHKGIYEGDVVNITDAYVKAIERFSDRIVFLGHLCAKTFESLDVKCVIEVANKYGVGLEFNCANLKYGKTDEVKLKYLLKNADKVYVNSDAHTLSELRENRQLGFDYLKKNKII